ncbi:MAG TPA: 3-oxoadipate enol-lactonase [Roseiflexaceae bacterium]|nr:3-oxoadipate enol-lactonase [Roseiflexaceae bacterium]
MTNFVTHDGARLAFRADGPDDAPPLVFINSLGTDMHMWGSQTSVLGQGFRVVRYDTRGHGQSDAPEGPYTIEQLGQDALALLDHLNIERAHVCGLSLGGMVALWLAATHSERVSRAVFANTAAQIGSAESWQARIDAVQAGGMAAVRGMVLARFLSPRFRKEHPAVTSSIGDMLEATDPTGYIGACAALRDTDLHPIVSAISAPSLIIAGTLDESTPPAQSDELHAAIAGSELIKLPAGHLSNIEQPEQFSDHLLRFLVN